MVGPLRARWMAAVPAIVTASLGLLTTLLVVFVPALHFAYRSVVGHLAMENLDASIAAVVAVLFYGRYRRTAASRDLLVASAFTLLSASGFMLVVLPAVTASGSVVWTSWIPLVVRLFAAGLIALAAADPQRRINDRRELRRVVAVAVLVLAVVIVVGVVAGQRLPTPLDPTLSPEASNRPALVGSSVVLTAQALHAVLYGFAAVAFSLQAVRGRDDLTRWLGAGCAFAAFARVNYFLFPSLYSQWLYTGDFLRTAFYVVLGIGAVRELSRYWNVQAENAVFAERRRIARDLHDGTVQELGYIRSLARQAARDPDPAAADRIAAAAERALAEAREAIASLSLPLDEPLAEVVRRSACEIADRYDVEVRIEGEEVHEVDRPRQDAIVRIVREAVSNAARHADAHRVDVLVRRGSVEICDDGRGFDPEAVVEGRYGLVSMRERAESVGGVLSVTSRPGAGTTVRVEWDESSQ